MKNVSYFLKFLILKHIKLPNRDNYYKNRWSI